MRVAASANNAELELGAGGLSNPIVQPATLAPDNSLAITTQSLSGLTLAIKSASGQFRGSFIHPANGTRATFRGVIVQKENAGFGFFVTAGAGGYVTLAPSGESQP